MAKVFKGLKRVASVALPIAGSIFGGPLGALAGGAIGTKLGGGSWGDALTSGLLSGATAGLLGGGGSLFDGATTGLGGLFNAGNNAVFDALSPLRQLGSNLFSSVGNSLSNTQLGSLLGLSNSGAAPIQLGSISASDLGPLQKITSKGPLPWLNEAASATGTAAQKGILEQLKDSIMNPGMRDLTSLAGIVNMLNPDPGLRTQQEILREMQESKAKQQRDNERFVASLNSAPLQRAQTNPNIDYYTYGQRPEQMFYDRPEGEPMRFAKGGSPLSQMTESQKGQADTVSAKLSVGEYVIPADIVSSLGDGNTEAGAKALDEMLKNVRKHKAPAMKKGVLPPQAKSPLAYIGA